MFCQNCGTEFANDAAFCPSCGTASGTTTAPGASAAQPANQTSVNVTIQAPRRNKAGGQDGLRSSRHIPRRFGIHHFYAGKTGAGVVSILFCWTFIPAIVGFIQGIVALCKTADAYGNIYV